MTSLGTLIRATRLNRRLSQAALAKAAGVSAVYLSQLENSQRVPSDALARHLAEALGLPWPEFLRDVYVARSAAAEELFSLLGGPQPCLTFEEIALVELLGECWNRFAALPDAHPADGVEFARAIHELQRHVMARLARRVHPDVFTAPAPS